MTKITVGPLEKSDIPLLADLVVAQEQRWQRLDARLRPPRDAQLMDTLLSMYAAGTVPPLVVRDPWGRARGYVLPSIREFSPQSLDDVTMLEVFPPTTGFVNELALPDPEAADAVHVATTLLEGLQDWFQRHGARAQACRWPACDTWLEEPLRAAGYVPFMYRAVRRSGLMLVSSRSAPEDLLIRRAVQADEDTLVALYLEESQYHHEHSPFFQMVPGLAAAFRFLLQPAWDDKPVEEGGPLLVVAERAGAVVGMAYNYAVQVQDWRHRDYLPLGRYLNIAEVGVRADQRGQGVGRALVQGVFAASAELQPDGYVLGFSPHNPLSSQFWPRLGFQPSLKLYQRRATSY